MLLALLWAVRIYTWLIVLWAVLSLHVLIPNPVGSWLGTTRSWLDTPMWPIWKFFGWANLGPFNLGAMIVVFMLFGFESYLKNQLGKGMQEQYEVGEEQEDQEH